MYFQGKVSTFPDDCLYFLNKFLYFFSIKYFCTKFYEIFFLLIYLATIFFNLIFSIFFYSVKFLSFIFYSILSKLLFFLDMGFLGNFTSPWFGCIYIYFTGFKIIFLYLYNGSLSGFFNIFHTWEIFFTKFKFIFYYLGYDFFYFDFAREFSKFFYKNCFFHSYFYSILFFDMGFLSRIYSLYYFIFDGFLHHLIFLQFIIFI